MSVVFSLMSERFELKWRLWLNSGVPLSEHKERRWWCNNRQQPFGFTRSAFRCAQLSCYIATRRPITALLFTAWSNNPHVTDVKWRVCVSWESNGRRKPFAVTEVKQYRNITMCRTHGSASEWIWLLIPNFVTDFSLMSSWHLWLHLVLFILWVVICFVSFDH